MNNFYGILFTIFSFTSCDVPGILILKNNSKNEITLRIYNKENSRYTNIQLDEMKLTNKGKMKNGPVMFGFGHSWSERKTQKYISSISKIEIITPSDTLKIEGQTELTQFFATGKKKFFKKKLIVKLF